ncbi:redoxin domain-containing protein [Granulicella sp. dw_53]|uniref:peroxiredoxin family protein n=1 Tax=Granulicella sp. dw_53 TaxID=2719792 RepID=UPI001BD3380A|nr:redoxin domain-containing protein [Granulicella sp. dw_53]
MTYPLIHRIVVCSLLMAVSPFAFGLPEPGDVAPAFSLKSQSGSPVSLKGYKGDWVILFFFGDHSSEDIGLIARELQRDLAKYSSYTASVIGIGRTSPESNQKWADENGLTFPLLSDPDQAIAKAYGVQADGGIYEVIVAPSGKVQLPRIVVSNVDGESTHLLACLQYFKDAQSVALR